MQIQLSEHFTFRKLLRFVLPSIIMMIFTSIYSVVDGLFVSNFVGKTALAAINLTLPIIMGLSALGFMIGTGGSAIVARMLGEKKEDKANAYFSMLIYATMLGGIFLSVLGAILIPSICSLLGAKGELLSDCVLYARLSFISMPAFMLQNVFQSFFVTAEKPHLGLYVIIAAGMTNMVLDFLFVVGLQMGVMGAALATILSQIISAVLVMGSLMRTRDIYRLHLRKISIDWIMLKRIIRIGFPAGVQSILYSVSNVIIQSAVNSLGTNNVAAWAAYGKVDGLFWMMINALGIAATTFVGQNYGAKKMDRVHRGVRTSMIMAFLMTGLMVVFMWFIGDTLISLFTTDTAVREICHGLIHFLVPTFFTYISIEILSGALRGVGDAWIPMFITGIGICGVRIVWMTAVLPHFHSLKGAAFCYPLSWVITTIAYFIYYLFFSQLSKRKELRSI